MIPTDEHPRADVLGIHIDAIDMPQALARIRKLLSGGRKGFICATGVHGIMEAQRQPELFAAYAAATMCVPDGMPLVWVGRWQGHRAMQRVTGPDLMLALFTADQFDGIKHYLYGGRDGVAQDLRARLLQRNPRARIVGARTPPSHEGLRPEEEQDLVEEIAMLKPDIIWLGISCPKQELFMARYLGRLQAKLMFGVGAAFDFHTGRIQDSPDWVKQSGLQWLHRLLQDPRRLWRRYLRNNPAFIWRIALQFVGMQSPAQKTAREVRPAV